MLSEKEHTLHSWERSELDDQQSILSRDLETGFGLVVGFIGHYTRNYDSLTELHTPKITVTTAHIKSSQSSLAVAW
jgi:hypothetical protein